MSESVARIPEEKEPPERRPIVEPHIFTIMHVLHDCISSSFLDFTANRLLINFFCTKDMSVVK